MNSAAGFLNFLMIYGPFLAVILFAIYRLYKWRNKPHLWMRIFSIIVAIFPFLILAMLGLAMALGLLFGDKDWSESFNFGKVIGAVFFIGGPSGLVGFLYVLLGHRTRFELGMLIYGLVSYLGLLGMFLIAFFRENTLMQWYQEYLDGLFEWYFFFIPLFSGLYALFTVWVVLWNIKIVYKEVKENKSERPS